MPEPVSALVTVPEPVTTFRVPEAAPVATGSKVTLMVQNAPAARKDGQLLVWAKSVALVPVNERESIASETPPVLVSLTAWEALLVPVAWEAKVREVGERTALAGEAPSP